MESSIQNTLIVLVSILVAVLVVQTILMALFFIAFRNWCRQTGALIEQIARNIDPVLRASRELLTDGREKLLSVAQNLSEISQLAKGQMLRIDGFLKETTARVQLQIVRLDQLVGDTMDRVEETTEAIQQGVLKPVREVAALVAGVRAGMEFFFSRQRKTVERATQDEEMFI
jgi:hypothetical protein